MKFKPDFSLSCNKRRSKSHFSLLAALLLAGPLVGSVHAVEDECSAVYRETGAIPLSSNMSPPLTKKDRRIFFDCCWKAYGGKVHMGNWYCLNSPNALGRRIPEYCGSPKSSCAPVLGEFLEEEPVDDLKSKGEEENCKLNRDNPCNPVTGNKFQTEVDFRSANGHLDVVRYYNSLSPQDGVFGFGWTSSLKPSLALSSSDAKPQAVVYRADGRGEIWKKDRGAWQGDPDSKVRFSEDTAGFSITRPDGSSEHYDKQGKLISKRDRNGLSTQFRYDDAGKLKELIDPYSRKVTLTYNGRNKISTIITPDGELRYDYDEHDNLNKVTYPDGATREYLYGEKAHVSASPEAGVSYAHVLTGLVDENKVRFATWTYDKKGKVTSSEHAGEVGKATYERKADGKTIVTGTLGDIEIYNTEYLHNVVKLKSITGDQCSSCGNGRTWTYDANGNMSSTRDAQGNLTCRLYDLKRNLEIIRLEGLPKGKDCPADLTAYSPPATADSTERKITMQWHEQFRLPLALAEPLRLTLSRYDEQGRLVAQTVHATTDSKGGAGLNAKKSGVPRTTRYSYNSAGQLESIDGPRTDISSDITAYSYDRNGNLISVTNALQQTVQVGDYDTSGRPRSITDPNGLVTTLAYDLRGRLQSIKKGKEETVYLYDKAGSLTGITLPGRVSYTYLYDPAHRLTGIEDQDGNSIHFTLDKAGNRLKEEINDRSGKILQQRSREFDKASRLVKEIGAANQTIRHDYDENGNVTKITDALNRTVINQYDALNRLIVSTDPDGKPTHYSYDGQDQLIWVTDPRNLGTQYVRDGLNNLSKTVSPDTGSTTATFDEVGNISTRIDAKGQEARYSYDALNRLISISYTNAADQNITYSYDQGQHGKGRLTGIQDVTGSVEYSYDQSGRLLKEKRQSYGGTYITGYSYDAQGRLHQISYPSGRTVDYSFDRQGRIEGISTSFNGETKTVASGIRYQPFGGVLNFTFGNGQSYSRDYDQDGRVTSYTLAETPYNIAYDAASQIASIKGGGSTAQYAYDLLGRLTQHSQGNDLLQHYSYDQVGNRLSTTEGAITTSYSYPASSNRLVGIQQDGQETKNISYDPNGSMTEDQRRQYAYDVKGRLMKTTTAQGEVEYSVNAIGLRMRKKAADSDTVYHYDNQGRLIAEGTPGGTLFSKEYIYLGDQPVAVLQ